MVTPNSFQLKMSTLPTTDNRTTMRVFFLFFLPKAIIGKTCRMFSFTLMSADCSNSRHVYSPTLLEKFVDESTWSVRRIKSLCVQSFLKNNTKTRDCSTIPYGQRQIPPHRFASGSLVSVSSVSGTFGSDVLHP